MSGVNGGNPDPMYGNNPDEYGTHTCGLCGKENIKKLSAHLPECPES